MKRKGCVFFLIFLLSVGTGNAAKDHVYSVRELIELAPDFGVYRVKAVLLEKYFCPPCPREAMCKPCAGEHIRIADHFEISKKESGQESLTVFVRSDDLEKLKESGKYRFLIQVLNVKTVNQELANLKLIYFEETR